MDNSSLPAKALATLVSSTRSRGRQEKMDRQRQKDLHQRGSDVHTNTIGSRMRKRQNEMEEVCPCSPIVGNLRVKTDGSKKKRQLEIVSK